MEKEIRKQLIQMWVLMIGLIGLGLYAYDFVLDGIKAKAALNLSIFAIFGLAAGIAFKNVYSLKNEILAMKALQIDYDKKGELGFDVYNAPAVVFNEPVLLGHAYRMITEELAKAGKLSIPTSTVQNIINAIDHRISEKKATIAYFAGLMVFLGLLGAFMGLMKTVGSVGDLIGGMDLNGGGGDGAFAKLIEGMKGPLNGMSVGFSSSLFGLATSMVLGMYERMILGAMKALRNEFEAWLTKITQLEGVPAEGVDGGGGVVIGGGGNAVVDKTMLKTLRKMARMETQQSQSHNLAQNTSKSISEMSFSIRSLVDTVKQIRKEPSHAEKAIEQLSEKMAEAQRDLLTQFTGLIAAQADDRVNNRRMMEDFHQALERMTKTFGEQAYAAPMPSASAGAVLVPAGSAVVSYGRAPGNDVDAELAIPEPQGGARGLLQRLSRTLTGGAAMPTSSGIDFPERQAYEALVRDLAVGNQRMSGALRESFERLEQARAADRAVLLAFQTQQEHLMAHMAALARRVEALTEFAVRQTETGATTLENEVKQTRFALEVALKRLELQFEESRRSSEDMVVIAQEAVELATRKAVA
jgi:hypothetical protein